jgi:glycosyltransferase involved in cell wall biosynthesis
MGKRVLVLSNLYPPTVLGGYEVECSGVVERLRRDHEVLVLTSWKGRRHAGTEQGVVRRLPFLPHRGIGRFLAPLYAIRAAAVTRRALRDFRPEVVYLWNGAQVPQVSIRLLETWGATVAYRICEQWFGSLYESDAFMRALRGGPWKRSMRALNALPGLRVDVHRPVDVAVCWNSEMVQREAQPPSTTKPVLERIVIPATKQSEEFVDLPRRPSAQLRIGYVGRISPEKGIDVALRAVAMLRQQDGLEVELEVAGTGERALLDQLEALATELGIAAQVRFRGRLDPAGLRELLCTLHGLVVPSTWEEPAPLVIVEGALARVPLIASRVGGIPEMVRDPEEALLCPPRDPGALAKALRRTLTEPAETQARAERAFERVQAFRIDRYHEAMDAFFADAIEATAAGGAR